LGALEQSQGIEEKALVGAAVTGDGVELTDGGDEIILGEDRFLDSIRSAELPDGGS
jgi:hypothetical protein